MSASYLAAAALAFVASPAFPMTIFAIGAVAFGGIYLRFIKGTARAQLVEDLSKRAFNIVEDLKAQGRLPPGAAKPVIALEQLAKMLNAHGLTLTSGIEDLARAIWSSMHAPDNAGPASTTEIAVSGFKPKVEVVETGKPTARRMGFIAQKVKTGLAALGVIALCLPSSGCVTAWTAAVKASPACYQISGTNLEAVASEVYQVVTDLTSTNAIGAAEQIVANEHIDYDTALCIYQIVENQIANPKGGEAAYVPPPDAGVASVDLDGGPEMALARAVAMTPQQTTALERIHALQLRAQSGAVR